MSRTDWALLALIMAILSVLTVYAARHGDFAGTDRPPSVCEVCDK